MPSQEVQLDESLLPVTGQRAPETWGEDVSRAPEISVEEFQRKPEAENVYQKWARGELTDHYVGRNYGYAVLGNFYRKKDWASGVFGDEVQLQAAEESAPVCAETGEESAGQPAGGTEEAEAEDVVAPTGRSGSTPAASSSVDRQV